MGSQSYWPKASKTAAASRIVEIQKQLVTANPSSEELSLIMPEQRRLWDTEFPGVPYERIARQAEAQINRH